MIQSSATTEFVLGSGDEEEVWILSTGIWNDSEFWDDSQVWND